MKSKIKYSEEFIFLKTLTNKILNFKDKFEFNIFVQAAHFNFNFHSLSTCITTAEMN
jgi:hypothetical protein